ncbi:MAG: DinB family protein [Acidobacteriota bacterium]|nr:DinB family protein [Acidobacteriota bacterium]
MQQLQPDQAHFLLHGVYLPGLKNEHRITKSIFEAIPFDKGDYRPDEVSRSALDLAWHIASTEMRFMEAVVAGEFDFSPRPLPDSLQNSRDLTAWYHDNFESSFDKLTKLSNDQLLKIADFRGMFQLPVVMYLNFMLNHSIHHRGQLSMYLRPMGAKVPAIYGESYDSAMARNAGQQSA